VKVGDIMISIKADSPLDGYFTRLFKRIYIATSSKSPSDICDVPSDLKQYIDMVSFKIGEHINYEFVEDKVMFDAIPENKKIMIAFSSGKDCVAVATKFLEEGYEVVLYHLRGVNRSYTQEYDHSKAVADYLGCEFISDTISISGKCDYIENPIRNQFILAMMVDKGLKIGIYRYAFGNQTCDTLEGTNPDIMNSDSIELFHAIELFYQNRIPGFHLYTVLRDLTDSYCQVAKYDSELFRLISSCNGPLRFKAYRKKENEAKFGIALLPDRCGTCYKCANEAVLLQILGVMDYPPEYIEYCNGVMARWTDKLYTGQTKPKWYDEEFAVNFQKEHGSTIKRLI
jgi:hypothetical protein